MSRYEKQKTYVNGVLWLDVRRSCRKSSIAAVSNGSCRRVPFKIFWSDEWLLQVLDEDDFL